MVGKYKYWVVTLYWADTDLAQERWQKNNTQRSLDIRNCIRVLYFYHVIYFPVCIHMFTDLITRQLVDVCWLPQLILDRENISNNSIFAWIYFSAKMHYSVFCLPSQTNKHTTGRAFASFLSSPLYVSHLFNSKSQDCLQLYNYQQH